MFSSPEHFCVFSDPSPRAMSKRREEIDELRDDLVQYVKQWKMPSYASMHHLRAASVEVIYGLCCCNEDIPDTAPRLGETMLAAFFSMSKSEYLQCLEMDSAKQIMHIFCLLDDVGVVGEEGCAWIKTLIEPCVDVDEVLQVCERYSSDSNTTVMCAIASMVFPAGVRHLHHAMGMRDREGHVAFLYEGMKHMYKASGGKVYIYRFDMMLSDYSHWIEYFKACKRSSRKGHNHAKRDFAVRKQILKTN